MYHFFFVPLQRTINKLNSFRTMIGKELSSGKYKKVDMYGKINVYHLNLSETPYTRMELLKVSPSILKFCKEYNVTLEEFERLVEAYKIEDSELFSYTLNSCAPSAMLVAERYFYSNERPSAKNKWKGATHYHNLYAIENEFISLRLNMLFEHIMINRFPKLFQAVESKELRFKNIKAIEKLLAMPKTKQMTSLSCEVLSANNLTIEDFVHIIEVGDINVLSKEYVTAHNISVYQDNGYIFIPLNNENGEKRNSLYLKYQDLVTKDWGEVEKREVFSIPYYDENGKQIPDKFYKGEQKHAPYFTHPIVEKVRKALFE